MEWMYRMYLSVVAWNKIKPTINSVNKNDLGHYSWSNSEFIDDHVWLNVFIWNMPRMSWYVRVLSIINHVYIHSIRSTTEATEKLKQSSGNFPVGGGIWTAIRPRMGGGGFEQNFSKNSNAQGIAGEGGGCGSFELTGAKSNVQISLFCWVSLGDSITVGFPKNIFTSLIQISAINP